MYVSAMLITLAINKLSISDFCLDFFFFNDTQRHIITDLQNVNPLTTDYK